MVKYLYISTHELILDNWKGVNYYENKTESNETSVIAFLHFFNVHVFRYRLHIALQELVTTFIPRSQYQYSIM